ncbi:pyridoxal 5'-phosphate synthase-like subunit PDX1.2 [Tanacetum coccineum]
MVLTNTPFNGSNFHGWNRNVMMALDAKLKLGFIDGSCVKPGDKNFDPMKLNDEYELVRSQIFAMDPLPTINKAYYIVQQIKKQKQVTSQTFEPTAFFANMNNKGQNGGRKESKGNRIDGKRYCTGCFDEHFTVESPFDIGIENEVAMNQNGGYDQKLVAVVCQEVMKMFKGNDIAFDGNAGPSYAVFGLVVLHPFLFITVTYLKNLIIVHLPDGSSKTVTIVGSVKLTPTLILTNVFYVPDFQLNLLSAGQLSQNNQLVAHFYPNDFCFQDLSTNQIVVVGKGSSLDKQSYSNSVSKNVLDVHTYHARLGHSSVRILQKSQKNGQIRTNTDRGTAKAYKSQENAFSRYCGTTCCFGGERTQIGIDNETRPRDRGARGNLNFRLVAAMNNRWKNLWGRLGRGRSRLKGCASALLERLQTKRYCEDAIKVKRRSTSTRLNELMRHAERNDLRETEGQQVARYLGGLKPQVSEKIGAQVLWTLNEAKNTTLRVELMRQDRGPRWDSNRRGYRGDNYNKITTENNKIVLVSTSNIDRKEDKSVGKRNTNHKRQIIHLPNRHLISESASSATNWTHV